MVRPIKQLEVMAPHSLYALSLRRAMTEAGLTPKQLCERVGISPTALSFFMNGVRLPTPQLQDIIARALGVCDGSLTY